MSKKESYIFFDKDTDFQGEISTDRLILEGMISGEIHARVKVLLKQGSVVQGEIATKKYLIQEGSIHQGRLKIQSTDRADDREKMEQAQSEMDEEARASASDSTTNGTPGDSSSKRLW